MLEKLNDSDLTLDTGTTVIRPLKPVRDLGVHLASDLTMKTHISKVVSYCYHQLRRIRQVRRLVGQDVAQQLVSALILSRLDYCNSVLFRLPTVVQLQTNHHKNREINSYDFAACDECSGSSHHGVVVVTPCEASSEAATLAAG